MLLSLPVEILIVVLEYVHGRDLKNARLTCKALAPVAEEHLFREFVLVPHMDSFRLLLKLARHATLSKHVEGLVYDTRMLLCPFNIMMETEATGQLRDKSNQNSSNLRATLKHHETLSFKTVEQTEKEIRYLIRAFKYLPSLTRFTVRGVSQDNNTYAGLPHFYQRIVDGTGDLLDHNNFGAMGKLTHRTRSVLLAAFVAGKQLQELCLEDVVWRQFFDLSELREPTRYLRLVSSIIGDLWNGEFKEWYHTQEDRTAFLNHVLDKTIHAESLHLQITSKDVSIPHRRDESLFTPTGTILSTHRKLERLHLTKFTASEDELLQTLLEHSATLFSLTIEDARLLTKRPTVLDDAPRPACWIRVLEELAAGLNLQTFALCGTLSNGGNQKWHLSAAHQLKIERNGETSLKTSVESFLVHRGDFPQELRLATDPPRDCDNQMLGDESFRIDGRSPPA